MAFIVPLVMEDLRQELLEALSRQDLLEACGVAAPHVQIGRLQDNPDDLRLSASIIENDFDDPGGWLHERLQQTPIQGPQGPNLLRGYFELSGGDIWIRRFTVKLDVYLTRTNLSREEAGRIINLALGIVEHRMRNTHSLYGISDEFGEQVSSITKFGVAKSEMVVSGGPPSDWIGRGKVWFEVYTDRP